MRILEKILAVMGITVLLFLTSCQKNVETKKTDKQNNVSEISESNFEYKLSEETVFDTNVILSDSLVDQYKDGFVFTGSASYTGSEFLVLSGKSDGQTELGSFNLDTAATDVISVKKKDDIIYLLCGKEGKGSITSFDQNGSQIEKTELDFCPSDFEVSDKIYILNTSLSPEIDVYSDKLVFEESMDVSYNSDGIPLYPYMIAASPENEIYCVLSEINDKSTAQVMLVGKNNKIICKSVDDMNSVDDIFIDSTGNIILIGNENGNYLVDELDKNGSIVSMSEIQNCDEVYGITESDKIIFSNSKGILAFYNDKSELIIKSDDFKDNSIFACCIEADGCTAYLSSAFEKYNAVFITDQNNQIVSEIKADRIDDCFVQNDKVYVVGMFEEKRTVKIFDNENIIDTGIELNDNQTSYKIGVLKSGEIIINSSDEKNFTIYSDTFEKVSSKSTNICANYFFKSNDSIYCYDYENAYSFNEKYETEKIDLNINQFGNNIVFSSGNDEYEFLFSVSKGLYGYNKSENSAILLVDYNKELLSDVRSFLISKDKRILINSIFSVYECQKCDNYSSKDSQKQKLTLAYDELAQGLNTLKQAVNTFNSTSEQFEIEMKGYPSDENGTAQSLLALDIVSGDTPDIIMTNLLSENIVTLLKNDILTDMNQFIEKDNELSRDMFYPSILDAFTYKGKLYSLPLTFTLQTGKTNDNIITDTCSEQIDHISNTYTLGEHVVDYSYVSSLVEIYLSETLDFENKKYSLSEMDLKKIIYFYRNYSEIFNKVDYTDLQYNDKLIARGIDIDSLEMYYHNLLNSEGRNSEDYCELGYPGIIGVLRPNICFSIMDKCENKDAIWEFIKICYNSLGNNYEDGLYTSKSLNTNLASSDMPQNIEEKFDSWMKGKCINYSLYVKLDEMIYQEIILNPDISDEELSHAIYNKMKLYFAEIQ